LSQQGQGVFRTSATAESDEHLVFEHA
jgi:hypothetical protein